MKNWCEIPEDQRSDEQKEACRRAYLNTLLKDDEGREVFADMIRRVLEYSHVSLSNTEYAVAVHVLKQFMRDTRTLCGPVSILATVEAQFDIAKLAEPEKPTPMPIEGYDQESHITPNYREGYKL